MIMIYKKDDRERTNKMLLIMYIIWIFWLNYINVQLPG